MATSQETFVSMMKGQIAPALRAMGFKGSGQIFALPDDAYFAQLGFQRSSFSDSTSLKFTINVSVADRDAWAEARSRHSDFPVKPSPHSRYGDQFWFSRIGRLMPSNQDTWWWIRPGMDTTVIERGVLAAIRDFALPAMREQIGRS